MTTSKQKTKKSPVAKKKPAVAKKVATTKAKKPATKPVPAKKAAKVVATTKAKKPAATKPATTTKAKKSAATKPATKPAAKKSAKIVAKAPAKKSATTKPAKSATTKAKKPATKPVPAKKAAKIVAATKAKKSATTKTTTTKKKSAKPAATKPVPAKKNTTTMKKTQAKPEKKPTSKKKTPKIVATTKAKKSAATKAVKPATTKPEKKSAPAKKASHNGGDKAAKKGTVATTKPAKPATTKPAKSATTKAEKTPATTEPEAPAPRNKGALIVSKRGRKPKKSKEDERAQAIFVPRDVEVTKPDRGSARSARAYSPEELEQLLFRRGVTNMNIFDPRSAPSAADSAKSAEKRKVILTELPTRQKKAPVGPVSVSDLFGFDPFAKNSASQEESQIPEKWRKYYRKLIERKNGLLARINDHSQKAFRKEGKEETGDVSAYSQHTADIDNEAFDRDFAISRLSAEQEELSEINIAIERMKKGTYGICEITGKPIPAERLNKVPFTRYSLQGKIEAEKQRGLEARRRRANATGDLSDVIDIENDSPISLPEENDEP